jgi:hypothetical protein
MNEAIVPHSDATEYGVTDYKKTEQNITSDEQTIEVFHSGYKDMRDCWDEVRDC